MAGNGRRRSRRAELSTKVCQVLVVHNLIDRNRGQARSHKVLLDLGARLAREAFYPQIIFIVSRLTKFR
jgi:hypothetical protein